MLYSMAHHNQVTRLVMNDTSLNDQARGWGPGSHRVAAARSSPISTPPWIGSQAGGHGSHGWAMKRWENGSAIT